MRLALLATLVLLSGCVSTRSAPLSITDTAARLSGERVTVVLADGTAWQADALRLAPDSTSWYDTRTGAMHSVPTADIEQVRHYDSWRTAQRGAALGAIVASLVAFATQRSDGFLTSPTSYADGGIGPVAFTGAVAGALGSVTFSAPERYVFTRPDSLRTR